MRFKLTTFHLQRGEEKKMNLIEKKEKKQILSLEIFCKRKLERRKCHIGRCYRHKLSSSCFQAIPDSHLKTLRLRLQPGPDIRFRPPKMVKVRMNTADVAAEVKCLRRLIGMRCANVYDLSPKVPLSLPYPSHQFRISISQSPS